MVDQDQIPLEVFQAFPSLDKANKTAWLKDTPWLSVSSETWNNFVNISETWKQQNFQIKLPCFKK